MRIKSVSLVKQARGNTGGDRVVGQVTCDHGTGTNLHAAPDGHARQDDRADADVGMVADLDRLKVDAALDDWLVDPLLGVLGGEDLHTRPDADLATDRNPAGRVEVALLADPALIADHHPVLVVALKDRVVADVDAGADLDVPSVEDQYRRLDVRLLAEPSEVSRHPAAVSMRLLSSHSLIAS